jgi:hypothetical protein
MEMMLEIIRKKNNFSIIYDDTFLCCEQKKNTFQVTEVVVIGEASKFLRNVYGISGGFFSVQNSQTRKISTVYKKNCSRGGCDSCYIIYR